MWLKLTIDNANLFYKDEEGEEKWVKETLKGVEPRGGKGDGQRRGRKKGNRGKRRRSMRKRRRSRRSRRRRRRRRGRRWRRSCTESS